MCCAPKAFREMMSLVEDLDWLYNIPEHIEYPRSVSSFSKKQWIRSWPPAVSAIYRVGVYYLPDMVHLPTDEYRYRPLEPFPNAGRFFLDADKPLPDANELFEILADWVDDHPPSLARGLAQQLWEVGGFLIPSLCRRLVDSGAIVNCKMWDSQTTDLQVAAAFADHDVLKLLLDLGADPIQGSRSGYTALHFLFLHENAFRAEPIHFPSGEYHQSRIVASIKTLAKHTEGDGSLVNIPDYHGTTPLMLAAEASPKAVKALLEAGAEVNRSDSEGRTALMYYFERISVGTAVSTVSILKYLLHAGANSLAVDCSQKTVLWYWAQGITSRRLCDIQADFQYLNMTFHELVSIGALSQRDTLVDQFRGLDVPLAVASRLGNAQLCWALLDAGADPDGHGIPTDSPLYGDRVFRSKEIEVLEHNPVLLALEAKTYVTAAILLAYGAKVMMRTPTPPTPKRTRYRSRRQCMSKAGITPLHMAVGGQEPRNWVDTGVQLPYRSYSDGCAFAPVAQTRLKSLDKSSSEVLGSVSKHGSTSWTDSENSYVSYSPLPLVQYTGVN